MFGIRMKELRERAGYKSQQAFADAFGIAQSTVGGWEAGKREPNYETTIKLADYFGVSIDYLLGRDEKKPTPSTEDGLSEKTKQFMDLVDQLTFEQQRLLLAQMQAWIEQDK